MYKGKLYITTNEDAPRYRVFTVDATNPKRDNWKEIIPQSDAVLQFAAVFGGKLYTQYEHNASSELKLLDLDGKKLDDIALPTIGTIFASGGKWDRDEAFFGFQSFTVPPSIFRLDLKDRKAALWSKVDAPSIDPSAYEVKQEWYVSKDGTRVPMFLVSKKGVEKNGKNPTLLTGYGGFNVSETPAFSRSTYLWMEQGGVYAVANLRGGAEFGEDWHRAGMLEKKQNVFDDFIAAAEYLIAHKYTDKDHLAIRGGLEWRTADGRHDHAASGSVPRGTLPGASARYAALPEFSNCEALDTRIRVRRRSKAVRLHLRLLAISPRQDGR